MARGGETARPRRRRRLRVVDPDAHPALPQGTALDVPRESELLEQRSLQRLRVADLGRAALQGSDTEQLAGQAVDLAVDTMGADGALILELDDEDGALVVTAAGGRSGTSFLRARVPADPATSFLRVALGAPEPLLVEEWASETRFALDALFGTDQVHSACATPIRGPQGSVGVVAALSDRPAAFTPDDCNFLRTIANVLGAARARQRAEDELRASETLLRETLQSERLTRLELEESVARLDTLLQHAPVAFGFFDRELRFLRLNDQLAALSGLPIEEHLGRHVADVLPDAWPELEDVFSSVLRDGRSAADVELSAQLAGAPGLERHFVVSCYPVRSEQGEVFGLGALVVDITERRRAELAASLIGRASELLARQSDLAAALDEAVEIPIPEFADSCQVYLFSNDERPWYAATAHGEHRVDRLTAADDARYPIDPNTPGAISDAVSSGRAQLVARVSPKQTSSFARDAEHRRVIEERGLSSAIVAPLVARGEALGLLFLTFTGASGRRYRPDDLELAEELAARFALVVDARRLQVEARRAEERLDLLARAGALMVVELDTGERMQKFARLPIPSFADVCAIHVLDDGKFRLEAFAGRDEQLGNVFARPEDWAPFPAKAPTPNADACRSRRAVLIADLPGEIGERLGTQQAKVARTLRIGSLLCAPLIGLDGEAFGTLTFVLTPSARRYSDADVPVAEELGRRGAAFLQHAIRFEQEQATVQLLQRSLLPARLPEIAGIEAVARYLPSGVTQRVGGDWYDVVGSGDGSVVLAIGDVVGHGLAAAWFTGQLRAGVHLAAMERLGPTETLGRLNRLLLNVADADMATVALLVYEPAGGVLRLATAGHPPPLLVRRDGARELLEGPVGFPLRASAAARYEETSRPFGAGDLVVLYTDGLVERRGESLDVGLARLGDAIADAPEELEGLADHLLRAMLPDAQPYDDVALVVMRAVSKASPLYVELPARAEELASARESLRSWLRVAGVEPDEARDIVIAANEALANAIEHGSPSPDAVVTLTARQDEPRVVIAVRDRGQWRKRAPRPDRGRGIQVMRAIMDTVDFEPSPNGTTVTLERAPGE